MSEPTVTLRDRSPGWPEGRSSAMGRDGSNKARGDDPSARVRARLVVAAVAVMLAAGWHRTMIEMWFRWFPGWPLEHLGLIDRLTHGDSYYSHGPLVWLVSCVLAVVVYRRVGFPVRRSTTATRCGVALLVASAAVHLLSVSPGARVMFASGFALVGFLGGLVLLWGGWPAARAYRLPVALLLFMVPLPEVAVVDLNFRLKFLASTWAVWLANHALAVPALLEGSYIYLPPDAVDSPKFMVIENVCGGLRSLIALVWFAALFAIICRVKGVWRWAILSMAVPVAVVCNVVRITALGFVGHRFGLDTARPGGWFHDLSGVGVFALALAVMIGIESSIAAVGRLWRRDWAGGRPLAFLDALERTGAFTWAPACRASLVAVVFVAVLSVYWSLWEAQPRTVRLIDGVPRSITVDGERFVGQDRELDAKSLAILEHPDYLLRSFVNEQSGRSIELLIVFSANNRKGFHPPEVCIEGGGQIVVEKHRRPVRVAGVGELALRELLTQHANRMTCYLYTYQCGDRFTPSFLLQQFWIFAKGLTAQDTFGSLIRLSVSDRAQSIEPSRGLALAAAGVLLPSIDSGLRGVDTP